MIGQEKGERGEGKDGSYGWNWAVGSHELCRWSRRRWWWWRCGCWRRIRPHLVCLGALFLGALPRALPASPPPFASSSSLSLLLPRRPPHLLYPCYRPSPPPPPPLFLSILILFSSAPKYKSKFNKHENQSLAGRQSVNMNHTWLVVVVVIIQSIWFVLLF